MKIEQAIEIYLNWKKTHTTAAATCYKIRLQQFAEFVNYRTQLNQVTGDDIVAFHRSMETNYSLNTIAYTARVLRNFFTFWHGRRETDFNPKEIISIKFVSADKDIVTKDDFEDMDDTLGVDNLIDLQKKLVLNLLWDTGIRLSELLDIKLSDIDKQGTDGLRTAKVRTRKTMRYNLMVWGEKTNDLLNRYLGIRLCIDSESQKLFINSKTGKCFTPRSIQRWIQSLSKLAMINKNITPHSFRHGKANYILDCGGSVRDVSAILRHVKPESSFQYMQLSAERYKVVAKKYLNQILENEEVLQTV